MRQRKKNTRQRGGTTHGWGSMKKHRGAGNRGGRGNAGSGKRGDAKKPSYWKDKKYFGMSGFVRKGKKIEYNCINVAQLDALAQKAGKTELKLSDFGYNKLLGTGNIKKPLKVTVDYATTKAASKINSAKGELIVLNNKVDNKKNIKEDAEKDIKDDPKADMKADKKEDIKEVNDNQKKQNDERE